MSLGLCVIMLNVITPSVTILMVVMLNTISSLQNVIMLSVSVPSLVVLIVIMFNTIIIILSVIMLSVYYAECH